MARIRSIKPEFWASPSVARASAVSRLAFIAMWNWADDHGRGTANLKELEGFIFPNDDVAELSSGNTAHFRDVVQEVATCFDVLFYEADGRPFYAIPTWDDHQRNERRSSSSKHPDPTDIPAFSWLGAEIPSQDTVNPNISGTGTGEQGNRGTGEQGNSLSTVPAETAPAKAVAVPDTFNAFWNTYDKKQGRKAAEAAYRAALKKSGVTSEQIIEAASEYVEWQKVEGKHPTYTKNAATWLRGEHWNDERSARERAKPRTKLDGFADVDAELAADEEGYSEVRSIGGAR